MPQNKDFLQAIVLSSKLHPTFKPYCKGENILKSLQKNTGKKNFYCLGQNVKTEIQKSRSLSTLHEINVGIQSMNKTDESTITFNFSLNNLDKSRQVDLFHDKAKNELSEGFSLMLSPIYSTKKIEGITEGKKENTYCPVSNTRNNLDLRFKIKYDSKVHDIYNPVFSSQEEANSGFKCSLKFKSKMSLTDRGCQKSTEESSKKNTYRTRNRTSLERKEEVVYKDKQVKGGLEQKEINGKVFNIKSMLSQYSFKNKCKTKRSLNNLDKNFKNNFGKARCFQKTKRKQGKVAFKKYKHIYPFKSQVSIKENVKKFNLKTLFKKVRKDAYDERDSRTLRQRLKMAVKTFRKCHKSLVNII